VPSIRDLKGHAVDEIVASAPRGGSPVPEPPVTLPPAAREALKRILDRPREGRESELDPAQPVTLTARTAQPLTLASPLPEDFDAGLRSLESALSVIEEQARLLAEAVDFARGQMAGLRARAEQDASRLAKLSVALKALTE